jgi:uncharacterized protein YbbC (DUF1343 family)/CubicO group peptidase (beta-lactamase class C family)
LPEEDGKREPEKGKKKMEKGKRVEACRFLARAAVSLVLFSLVHVFHLAPFLRGARLSPAQQPPAAKTPAQRPPQKAAPAKKSEPPEEITAPRLDILDGIFHKAMADDELPGAVVVVGWRGEVVFSKSYGLRAVLPAREPMTDDTIFDLASLTKIFATSLSVSKLIERGRIRLNDPVARYVPEFAPNGKDRITVRHLLTHTSGLRPIPSLPAKWSGTEAVLAAIYADSLVSPPGARFTYSDTGFIVLGELVRRVSGFPLDEFAARNIYGPLGLKFTRFRPPPEWRERIAPSEEIDLPEGAKPGSGRGRILRGEVHDPRARGMGGVAGHAGLFSTAEDLARLCQMILDGGVAPDGARIFAPQTLALMTGSHTPPWSPSLRGLGWDIDSAFSAPRGEIFPVGGFGHTGFTGTSVWLDPASRTYVIILSSTQHPAPRPAISSVRSRVATAVAAAVGARAATLPAPAAQPGAASLVARAAGASRPAPRNAQTQSGLDVLAAQNFSPLRGKRVGLITNHTGVDRAGRSAIELLANAEGVKLVALFSPEHGIAGRADEKVASGTHSATGLPLYSLYGDTRRPTPEMLKGLDALVFDIQDAGVRFYTYQTTMAYAMEEAAKRKIAFYVLDRPNPLGGQVIEGPMLDRDKLSFVGYFPLPVRHAMTIGELAKMYAAENRMKLDLRVVAMQDWRRADSFEDTGLEWIAPSPNLRSLDAALLYPGIEILQNAGVSVGRGTDTPFELFGAPWVRGVELAEYLNRRFVPGVKFVPVRFTPASGAHKDTLCQGAALVITDRASLHSMLMGLEIAAALAKLHPKDFQLDRIITLLGNAATLDRLKKGDAPSRIVAEWEDDLAAFRGLRAKYLLYE